MFEGIGTRKDFEAAQDRAMIAHARYIEDLFKLPYSETWVESSHYIVPLMPRLNFWDEVEDAKVIQYEKAYFTKKQWQLHSGKIISVWERIS